MTGTEWLLFILIIQVVHFLGTWKLYTKAGKKSWEALIPIYSALVLMSIINRPKWWLILLFIPVINLLMFPVIWVETSRSFGRNSTTDTWLSFLTLGFYIYYINYMLDVTYIEDRDLSPKSEVGEWVSSIIFAIIAATIVHTYVMQPYTIPTSSLEKSLLVGDFLFVSKFHYGAKTPMSAISAPMVHDTLPILNTKSYLFNDDPAKKETSWLNKFQLPYFRLPGFQKIKRNDIVVFNWPADTVQQFFKQGRKYLKPIDKKSNYVKRCVAIAGDSLEIRDGYIYINGKHSEMPDRAKPQFFHTVDTDGKNLSENLLYNKYHVRRGEAFTTRDKKYVLNLDEENAKLIAKNPLVKSIEKNILPKGQAERVFPSIKQNWNKDNYGPLYIPEEGKTVALTKETLPFYKRIITEYEHNTLKTNSKGIYINGTLVTDYTFKQNYYWMMGDNRHNSEDSRYWGFVPFDHVVGKPVFVWFSWDTFGKGVNKVRWERLFTTVHGEGKSTSYFYYFIGLILAYIAFSKYQRAKNN